MNWGTVAAHHTLSRSGISVLTQEGCWDQGLRVPGPTMWAWAATIAQAAPSAAAAQRALLMSLWSTHLWQDSLHLGGSAQCLVLILERLFPGSSWLESNFRVCISIKKMFAAGTRICAFVFPKGCYPWGTRTFPFFLFFSSVVRKCFYPYFLISASFWFPAEMLSSFTELHAFSFRNW